jgi:hypothetical protein
MAPPLPSQPQREGAAQAGSFAYLLLSLAKIRVSCFVRLSEDARPYSEDLRLQVAQAVESGKKGQLTKRKKSYAKDVKCQEIQK